MMKYLKLFEYSNLTTQIQNVDYHKIKNPHPIPTELMEYILNKFEFGNYTTKEVDEYEISIVINIDDRFISSSLRFKLLKLYIFTDNDEYYYVCLSHMYGSPIDVKRTYYKIDGLDTFYKFLSKIKDNLKSLNDELIDIENKHKMLQDEIQSLKDSLINIKFKE